MIRVVLVDDQELVRAGLRMLSVRDGDIEIVGEAADGHAGLDLVRQLVPDIVLMNIRMPRMDGILATQQITTDPVLHHVRVIMLTTFDDDEDILAAIAAGAAAYVLKDIAPDELRAAIRIVAAGQSLLSPAITAKVIEHLGTRVAGDRRLRPELLEPLTERERAVLAQIGRGDSNNEIGTTLHISPATARTYVSRLLNKLDARDRAHLVVISYESGLIAPGE